MRLFIGWGRIYIRKLSPWPNTFAETIAVQSAESFWEIAKSMPVGAT